MEIVNKLRQGFSSGITRKLDFRLSLLKQLDLLVKENERDLADALHADLKKPYFEAFCTEIAFVRAEIRYAMRNLQNWARPTEVRTPLSQFPGSSFIRPEPVGTVLIIGPWNFPLQLVLTPLVGAIAAGNCALIKPSELAGNTANILYKLISNMFDDRYINIIEGNATLVEELLKHRFEHIFFTGSGRVGKIVMKKAADHLTPVTLELGGKSPCIVAKDADIEVSAKRIAWGKFINAGQTCIAPDYILVDAEIEETLAIALKRAIHGFFGADPKMSLDYGRIINRQHFNRLIELIDEESVFEGGRYNEDEKYISPTILRNIESDSNIMREEIFGPILPIIKTESIDQAIHEINSRDKPLAIYLFTKNKSIFDKILDETSSGSVCLNDTVCQAGVPSLPFGGVGASGMGSYHGRAGFDTFSHKKSVLKRALTPDIPLRYPPYSDSNLKLMKWIL